MSLISVVIPAYNEAAHIETLVTFIKKHGQNKLADILVVDGGSTDDTAMLAKQAGARVLASPRKGRAIQMNFGAENTSGRILYFVHADTLPPASFADDIPEAISQGFAMGRYLSEYCSKSLLLKINAWLSRFDTFEGMGGDQTLFITRDLFERAGGFDARMIIMEEFEFCARARKLARYAILPKPVLISARKYETNGWLRVQRANLRVVQLYKKGAAQEVLVSTYRRMLSPY